MPWAAVPAPASHHFVVDNETLIDAQKNPEKHRGLMVRVAGYMAYFTELDKAAQDTIIDRTAHLA